MVQFGPGKMVTLTTMLHDVRDGKWQGDPLCAQDALLAYQKNFLWSGGSEDGGVIANVERELSIRATTLQDTPHSTFSR